MLGDFLVALYEKDHQSIILFLLDSKVEKVFFIEFIRMILVNKIM